MDREAKWEKRKIEWVIMNMRLLGNPMKEETAAKIAAGEYVLDATLEEHLLVTSFLEVLPLMETLAGMQDELCAGTLGKFYKVFSGGETGEYRKKTPVLFHLSYNPVLPQEIEPELNTLFRKLHEHPVSNPLEQAVHVHNELIRIYPYDQYSERIARAAMEYELLYYGKEMVPLTLSESAYNEALTRYLKGWGENAILENLRLNQLMAESMEEHDFLR